MLTLTENASTVVKTLTVQAAGTEEAGLRITSQAPDSTQYAVEVAAVPTEADVVVEEGGARVFLEPNAASSLDDKVLDAAVDDGGAVRFSIGSQPGV